MEAEPGNKVAELNTKNLCPLCNLWLNKKTASLYEISV